MEKNRILAFVLTGLAVAGLLGGIILIACNLVELGAVVWAGTTVFCAIGAKVLKSKKEQADEADASAE